MVFDGHIPVIPHDIHGAWIDPTREKVPGTRIADIGLVDWLAVNMKLPFTEFNRFVLDGDHTFQKHHFPAR
jgi:hypothetical protein